jgi:hypothetical protein
MEECTVNDEQLYKSIRNEFQENHRAWGSSGNPEARQIPYAEMNLHVVYFESYPYF